jgi:hypothetical protein
MDIDAGSSRYSVLVKRSAELKLRQMALVAESKSLCDELLRTWAAIVDTSARAVTLTESDRRREKRDEMDFGEPVKELAAALSAAISVLRMEFSGTEGSGRQTLIRCERTLRRVSLPRSFVLPL